MPPEDELIDISMDSPDGGTDSRWYRCASVAAFNTTLEFDATTPISGKVRPGVVIEALEHADTRAGRRRIRSHRGWFSLVSTNGTRYERPQAVPLGRQCHRTCVLRRCRLSVSLADSRPVRWARAGCSSRAADRKKRGSRGLLANGQARRGCLAPAALEQTFVGQGDAGRQRSGRAARSLTQTSKGLRASDSPASIRIATVNCIQRRRGGGTIKASLSPALHTYRPCAKRALFALLHPWVHRRLTREAR